jgi:hypothetical protein
MQRANKEERCRELTELREEVAGFVFRKCLFRFRVRKNIIFILVFF